MRQLGNRLLPIGTDMIEELNKMIGDKPTSLPSDLLICGVALMPKIIGAMGKSPLEWAAGSWCRRSRRGPPSGERVPTARGVRPRNWLAVGLLRKRSCRQHLVCPTLRSGHRQTLAEQCRFLT